MKAHGITPAIGAEISGVDLTKLTGVVADGLYNALLEHQVIFLRGTDITPKPLNDGMARFGHNIRPLIDTHPVTARKHLNFNEAFVTHIPGLPTNEANALKTWLANHMNKPEDQIRWRWRAGDLAMWNNRCTMH